jgi:hypothetical protein
MASKSANSDRNLAISIRYPEWDYPTSRSLRTKYRRAENTSLLDKVFALSQRLHCSGDLFGNSLWCTSDHLLIWPLDPKEMGLDFDASSGDRSNRLDWRGSHHVFQFWFLLFLSDNCRHRDSNDSSFSFTFCKSILFDKETDSTELYSCQRARSMKVKWALIRDKKIIARGVLQHENQ